MDINKWMPVCSSTSRKLLGMEAVPMGLFNEEWAQRNHGQTLHRLAERGGLGLLEMLDNIYKRRLSHRVETSEDAALLIKIIQDKTQPSTLPLINFSDEVIKDIFEKEPVNFFLANILRYLSPEKMKVLSDNLISRLPKSVPLIDKGEQSDAVEFTNWLDEKNYYRGEHRQRNYWFDTNGEGVGTADELYKIFKNKKQ